jgi:polar amino acid transport system substrate-binding protein
LLLLWLVLASLVSARVTAAQTPEVPHPRSGARGADSHHLRGGWYPWDPYQYREYRHGVSVLTGFDVEIERALARILRVEISLPLMPWEEHLAALADGRADIAAGATASPEREAFAYDLETLPNRN